MVLLATDGLQNKEIADRLGEDRMQVARWRQRYLEHRLAGIERDLPRGAPPVKVDVEHLVELTTQSKPEAVTHRSTRSMAAELGVSAVSVSRHWRQERPQAPSGAVFQGFARSPVYREAGRYRGFVYVPTGARSGALRG